MKSWRPSWGFDSFAWAHGIRISSLFLIYGLGVATPASADIADLLPMFPVLPGKTRTDALIAMQEKGLVPWAEATTAKGWGFRVIEIAGHSVPLRFTEAFAEAANAERRAVATHAMPNDGVTFLQGIVVYFESTDPRYSAVKASFDGIWPHCSGDRLRGTFYDSDWQRVDRMFSQADCFSSIEDEIELLRAATFSERHPDTRYRLAMFLWHDWGFTLYLDDMLIRETHASAIAAQLDLDPGALDWSAVPVEE